MEHSQTIKNRVIQTWFGTMYAPVADNRIAAELMKYGYWEHSELFRFGELVRSRLGPASSTGMIIEVGCNIGPWTLPLARRFPGYRILAIDCQRKLLDCLRQTLTANNITNVDIEYSAIGDGTQDSITIPEIDYDIGANFGAFELIPPPRNSDSVVQYLSGHTVSIPCRSLDQQEYQELRAIKIDVEGMEHLVLAGAVETIRKHRPIVLFENHKTDMQACNQILTNLGYRQSSLGGMLTWAEYDLWANWGNDDTPKTQ